MARGKKKNKGKGNAAAAGGGGAAAAAASNAPPAGVAAPNATVTPEKSRTGPIENFYTVGALLSPE